MNTTRVNRGMVLATRTSTAATTPALAYAFSEQLPRDDQELRNQEQKKEKEKTYKSWREP